MVSLMLAAEGAAAEPCALQGWSNDTDPAGLRVHAGPAIASAEIGRLPPAVHAGDGYAPNFAIVDVRGGWVRIARAADLDKPGTARAVFRGTGWVHASRVAFTVQSQVGRAAPDLRGEMVVRASDWLGDAGGTAQPILACAGGWARLRYRLPAGVRALGGARSGGAWFGGLCGNQHTTCDSLDETKSRSGRHARSMAPPRLRGSADARRDPRVAPPISGQPAAADPVVRSAVSIATTEAIGDPPRPLRDKLLRPLRDGVPRSIPMG